MTDIEETVIVDEVGEVEVGEIGEIGEVGEVAQDDFFNDDEDGGFGMEDEIEEIEEVPDNIKLFGKWSFTGIEVRDISLEVRIPSIVMFFS